MDDVNPLLVLVRPDVDDKGHHEQDSPACKGPSAPAETSAIQDETNHPRTDDLGKPIHDVIQRSGANVEQRGVIVVEFCPIFLSCQNDVYAWDKAGDIRQV